MLTSAHTARAMVGLPCDTTWCHQYMGTNRTSPGCNVAMNTDDAFSSAGYCAMSTASGSMGDSPTRKCIRGSGMLGGDSFEGPPEVHSTCVRRSADRSVGDAARSTVLTARVGYEMCVVLSTHFNLTSLFNPTVRLSVCLHCTHG